MSEDDKVGFYSVPSRTEEAMTTPQTLYDVLLRHLNVWAKSDEQLNFSAPEARRRLAMHLAGNVTMWMQVGFYSVPSRTEEAMTTPQTLYDVLLRHLNVWFQCGALKAGRRGDETMSCEACDKAQEDDKVAFFRWGNANIRIDGCEQHLLEIFAVLREYLQRQRAEMKP